ncbi:MAG: putative toxin-antitoxin system toxin component, PIN family [Candidatus Levybacteria bacterium RIFCSPHIGHO2_02_FULL_37_13]|nr:MAG: putative toxin-antitoxin system toxin component, PIN family [Candidatus Levybacteria bacterium RIFCSPHIGHO2_02_FULL_37_13]OGH30346.1 MAG: putative toxin-antitoxin system toxin component, PIN family [Candidatus Levybacteria bacterium RIFCSPHIGHO2_12_FULL_37_9]OGH38225.1 MAG: putative toxin-antitoxin system toxin component, PIN family [Candidatus Levybacteria bacterium RIFCSPLOWO2_01_FULL_37_26]
MRVFFDASVIIAALLSPTGGSSMLLQHIKSKVFIGITSQTVLEEILEKDKPKKLKRSYEKIGQFIVNSGLIIRESITAEEIEPFKDYVEEEDAHLFAGALLTKCAYLVSLDKKHVVRPDIKKKFLPLRIVTPKELLEEMSGR